MCIRDRFHLNWSSLLPLIAEKPPKLHNFRILSLLVAPPRLLHKKVECGCTSTNLPLSNGIKLVSQLQLLHGDMAFTNSVFQKRDGQKTNKKHRTFCSPGGMRSPCPTKFGMVIEKVYPILGPLLSTPTSTQLYSYF